MKIITILPVKNEEWILPYSLENFSTFSDKIIIADQDSTDKTLEICNSFPKVKVIKNPYNGHSNKIRWLLLDEARKIEGEKVIVCLDADELISPSFISEILKHSHNKPIAFSARWIQALDNIDSFCIDEEWINNSKLFAFIDDGNVDYVRKEVINDHTNRIPNIEKSIVINEPIVHLQYLAKNRCEIKQSWYMCKELINGYSARRINNKYSASNNILLNPKKEKIKDDWKKGIPAIDPNIFNTDDISKLNEIYDMFEEKGVKYFEGLNIWTNKNLRDYFILKTGYVPKPKFYPKFLILVNKLRRKLI